MVYEEVDLDDMNFNEETGMYTYLCPCGDYFQIHEVTPTTIHVTASLDSSIFFFTDFCHLRALPEGFSRAHACSHT